MKLITAICILFIGATARIPFLNKAYSVQEVKEGNYYYGDIAENITYPFQKAIIMNETVPTYYLKVTHNESYAFVNAQFLTRDNEGEMIPSFHTPLNGSVLTVRLHTMPCYPLQGGPYYRNNGTAIFGEVENEFVQTRATDENGYLNMTIQRPWAVKTNNSQSLVISDSSEGIILCTNINWREVDGTVSSFVSITTLLSVMGLIMKQLFFD